MSYEFIRLFQAFFLAFIFGLPVAMMWALLTRLAMCPSWVVYGVTNIVSMIIIAAILGLAIFNPTEFDRLWIFLWSSPPYIRRSDLW